MRLFDATRIAPIWIGLAIAATFMTGFAVLALAFAWTADIPSRGADLWRGTGWVPVQIPVEILQSLLIAFSSVITAYGLRGAVRDLEDLRPALQLSDSEFASWLERIAVFRGAAFPIVSAGGLIVGSLLPFSDGFWVHPPPLDHPLRWWVTLRTVIMSWLIARTIFIEVVVALRFMRLGRDHARVDLMDLTPLRPFARHGLRSVLFLMSFVALFSLMFVVSKSGQDIAALTSLSIVVFAFLTLALPAAGARLRIRASKETELQRVNAAIRRESAARLEPAEAWQTADSRLSDLIVYRGLVESLHTWPFDVSTLLRFGLYLVVGIGSWLGAAFVERLLGWALD